MDFVGLLGLGQLDVDGVKALCVFYEGDDVGTGFIEGNVVGEGGVGAGGFGDDEVGTSAVFCTTISYQTALSVRLLFQVISPAKGYLDIFPSA
ncbi:unnamed protein product [Lactuca virosa]|uniref:Uncharacterized protein n=1 Tax=Lactuca virosa TaxID=75947 RepID=A0AAU9MYA9_9ASTR|nr:unnamed protein product [Lactuca virosa]